MNPTQAVCNYALLRFMAEERMAERVNALFPQQDEGVFEAAVAAVQQDVERIHARIRDPKACQIAFTELVRPRENTFRFGKVRTVLTGGPQNFDEELFRRYVRMESAVPQAVVSQG